MSQNNKGQMTGSHTRHHIPLNLSEKSRIHERLIRYFLMFCGVLSIFTTFGIIAVLGQEAFAFFNRQLWENTNKGIAQAIDETQTVIALRSSGRDLPDEGFVRLGHEIMEIVHYDHNAVVSDAGEDIRQIEVIRGAQGTTPVSHLVDTPVEIGDRVSLVEFFTHTVWQPPIRKFGILPLVYGTLATSIIAMLVALPLGLGAAIYLSEYAPPRVRSTLKPVLEILAGIPTVVYGYFALTFMTPLLRSLFGAGTVEIYNSASAGIVVGILIIPLVSSMSEDALSAVPRSLREASYGLGATKLETTLKVVIPAALSGILAAFIIAISRAIGETMVVAIAAGAGPQNDIPGLLRTRGLGIIFQPAETMTGHMARISGGDLSYDSIDYNSIFAIGLMLFIITLILNLLSRMLINRFRERY
jgi:phosphate transport system permease protein